MGNPGSNGHQPEYLTLEEVALYSSMSRSTLRKWLRIGMPHFKLGRSIRIKRKDFDGWLEQFRAAGTDRNSRRKQALKEAVQEVLQ
jgi:excisionase family DNA binding protein